MQIQSHDQPETQPTTLALMSKNNCEKNFLQITNLKKDHTFQIVKRFQVSMSTNHTEVSRVIEFMKSQPSLKLVKLTYHQVNICGEIFCISICDDMIISKTSNMS